MLRSSITTIISLLTLYASTAIASADILWEDGPNQSISIQQANVDNTIHPASVSKQNLAELLTNLHSKKGKSGKTSAIFTEDQVQILSKYVSEGLSKLNNNEAIFFSISKDNATMGGLIKSEVFTAGTIYNSANGLTVLIGDHERERDYSYEAIFDPSKKGLVKYEFDYGFTNEKNALLLTLNTDRINTTDYMTKNNQLIMPLSKVNSLSTSKSKDEREYSVDNTDLISRNDVKKMIEDNSNLTREEIREIVRETKAGEPVHVEPSRISTSDAKSIEERFAILENLKAKGLITEEEYQKKRKELLAEI